MGDVTHIRDELPGAMEEIEQMMKAAVEHPPHYQGPIECIAALRSALSPEQFQGFCRGNVIKCLWRADRKGGVEDLRKAAVYLAWAVEATER